VSTLTISNKLKKVEEELGIASNEKEEKKTPLLFINGRLDRKKYNYIAKNFSLLEPLNKEIKEVCKGVDLTILNYLIFLGLEKLKENDSFESVEYSEFEKNLTL
jgi:signal recognition particle subunit SEC65